MRHVLGPSLASSNNTAVSDFFVRAYNANNGRVLWQSRVDIGSYDAAIAVDAEKAKVFIAGTSGEIDNREFIVRVYAGPSGALVWKDHIDRKGSGFGGPLGKVKWRR